MAKGFKLRLSLPSIRICRSSQPSSLPRSPLVVVPPPPMFTPVNPKAFDITHPKLPAPPGPPPSTPNHPIPSSKITPLPEGCVSKLSPILETSHSNTDSPAFPKLFNSPVVEEQQEEPVWAPQSWNHQPGYAAEINGASTNDPLLTSFSLSFSSLDHYSDSSFDSSRDFGYSIKTINEAKAYVIKRRMKNPKARQNHCWREAMDTLAEEDRASSSPEKKTAFEKLMPCMVEGKVNESYAVMQKSEDPYQDFKKSMMEMILEKQIWEAEDLEKLLMCFLSLNAKDHHQVIVEAFSEVWEELFSSKS